MKRLSMIKVQIITKDMKNKGEKEDPHVSFSTQWGAVRIQSNMMTAQSSPVLIRNRITIAFEKFRKFIYTGSIMLPVVI